MRIKKCYKPKKPLFKMTIPELQQYVNKCKKYNINKIKKKRTRGRNLKKSTNKTRKSKWRKGVLYRQIISP